MKAEDDPLTKGNYPTISGQVAISRGISVWFVQECDGQEGDGTMVWCKEDPQVRRSSIKCECE